ncbi:hypothetical protein QEN19_002568 [Hanseniaspora menglaensis]
MVCRHNVRIHWPCKFFKYTQNLLNSSNKTDGNLQVIGELISKNDFVSNYLIVSIVFEQVLDLKDADKYFLIGEINQKNRKFNYKNQQGGYETSFDVKIIEFDSPKLPSMQFYTTTPIHSKLFNDSVTTVQEESLDNYKNLGLLVSFMDSENLKLYPNSVKTNYDFEKIINFLNIADHHLKIFNSKYPKLVSLHPNVSLKNNIIFKPIFQFLNGFIVPYFFILVRILFCEILLKVFLNPLHWLSSYSIAFLQLHLRIKQFSYFPIQYLGIGERTILEAYSDNTKLYASYMDYIKYYNTIWLVVNDYSFALTLSSLLQLHKEKITIWLTYYLRKYLIEDVIDLTSFLSQNPYGIKLNDELSKFLKDLFLWIINFVNVFYFKFLVSKETVIFLIDVISLLTQCFGMTFAVAIVIDYLSILTLHFKLFYKISSKLYSWQLSLLISLFYLFCGKKYNTLRNRVDSEDYSLEVLLIGVLIFMILIFLIPTIVGFYLIYTCLQYISTILEIFLMTVLMCLNHFPLFIIMLKIKDGARVPSEISLNIKYESAIQTQTFAIKNVSLKWSHIFTNFLSILSQFQNEVLSLKLLQKCILGKDIIIDKYSLYKPLYSSVPKNTIKLKTLVHRLVHENPRKYN